MGDRGIVIVGAGECGGRAAFALREAGHTGPVTLIGAERHLPYERPPLSKDGMAGGMPAARTIADADRFDGAGIKLMLATEAVFIDAASQTVRLSDGTDCGYERLLLATGARPRRLPFAETSRHCLYLRTHDDAAAIAARLAAEQRVVIVGGGFIGLEIAAAARKRGCAVTVIEAMHRLLVRAVPVEIADMVADVHKANGVDLRIGTSIQSITDIGEGVAIGFGDGRSLTADLCIIGIGAVPNAELAGAAGITIDNGISVDETLRTSDPAIFAAGDCCSFPLSIYGGRRVRLESWRNAQDQGALAARNMLDAGEPHAAVPWFWSDQFDLALQIAGLVDEGRRVVRRDLGAGAFLLFHLADDGRLVAASGIGPGNSVARDIRLSEMLIGRRAAPPAETLAAPDAKLKSLLAA
ncbi:NAD(P)/FAD-dependent oxidoreductase [Mesorhizobium marinum]|uniref:NAD(P)/FAD-dependent oxidoreductase n=1 Tax=Mesorhizobium marinum TaxID=3228790 RepID=UPI0034671E8E